MKSRGLPVFSATTVLCETLVVFRRAWILGEGRASSIDQAELLIQLDLARDARDGPMMKSDFLGCGFYCSYMGS